MPKWDHECQSILKHKNKKRIMSKDRNFNCFDYMGLRMFYNKIF